MPLIPTDKPSPPEGPLEAIETTPNSISLQWKPPKDNGGSRIQKYVLEKKPKGSNKWTKVPVSIGPEETQATAKNLEEGEEYDFRVMAVNENGESVPLTTTEPIKAKYPFSKDEILFLSFLARDHKIHGRMRPLSSKSRSLALVQVIIVRMVVNNLYKLTYCFCYS